MRAIPLAAVAILLAIGGAPTSKAQQPAASRDSVARQLDSARGTPAGHNVPAIDRFTWGNLTVPAGTTVSGPIATARGSLDVRGKVVGDVFALGGDVVVHPGGEVTGSALALQGQVVVKGGRVGGEMRAVAPVGAVESEEPERQGAAAVRHALKITFAWLVIVLLVGLGVILFSGAQLEAVVQTLEHRFTTAFLVGIAAQVGAAPLLVLLCLALALTIVGILLIPFAVVAFILGVAGVVTLGALAAATVAGHALIHAGPNVRLRAVQSLVVGSVLLMLPWLANALLVNGTWSAMLVRIVAVAITWVAASAGLGAALLARGGVQRVRTSVAAAPAASEGWQTPTPIGGIVAARRPPAASTSPGDPAR